jgi:hypothetical protein
MSAAPALDKDRTASARTDGFLTQSRFFALQQKRRDGALTVREEQELGAAEEVSASNARIGSLPTRLLRPRRSSGEALRDLRRLVAYLRIGVRRRRPPRTTPPRRTTRARASRPHARRRTRSTPARGPDDADGGEPHGDLAGTGVAR